MDPTKQIYTRLLQVIPNLRNIGTYAKLSAPGFMDLHVDILNKNGKVWLIALAHNYKAGGDVIPDPDMEVPAIGKRDRGLLRFVEHCDLRKRVLESFRLKIIIRTVESECYDLDCESKDSLDQGTAGCWNPSALYHRRSWKRRIIASWTSQPWRLDSNKRVSGEPGAVQSFGGIISERLPQQTDQTLQVIRH